MHRGERRLVPIADSCTAANQSRSPQGNPSSYDHGLSAQKWGTWGNVGPQRPGEDDTLVPGMGVIGLGHGLAAPPETSSSSLALNVRSWLFSQVEFIFFVSVGTCNKIQINCDPRHSRTTRLELFVW